MEALDALVAVARQGHRPESEYFNPPDAWLFRRLRIFQDLPKSDQQKILEEAVGIEKQAKEANAQGKAAARVWPDTVFRLDSGGLAFFSQLGVARRPDLTQYFVDGFTRNRYAISFSEANQTLFAEILPYITRHLQERFGASDTVIQTDRRIGDVEGRSFHARQLIYGTHYLQLPYMWRQLTFEMPRAAQTQAPDILEVSLPRWLSDISMPEELKARIREAGLTQLIFKAPTKGLSLHLGFDYVGEHKMGPLSIAMFQAKQQHGLAVQAALSLARVQTLDGKMLNTAMVTVGPSLHGKSTLTIMIELHGSDLAKRLRLKDDPTEGIYPMNDDIVLLQRLAKPVETVREGRQVTITHGIDGTENSFYAVPFGLKREEDPITWDVVRGSKEAPNPQETLENVPVFPDTGAPNFMENPVRNMRMILNRERLLSRKGVRPLIERITEGRLSDSVHIPMENVDRVLWQAVMRQNTVVPPLRRLTAKQYIRVLMYGEAVQMGAAAGAIGRPYVEYFSDPFIIGLEDDNANLLYEILVEMGEGGLKQEYYVFNTGGIGADSAEEASGLKYKKIPRDITLMLQEALLRGAVKFEHDAILGSDVAVAIVDAKGAEITDLRREWLPQLVYGTKEYTARVEELSRRRYYSRDAQDRAGILRYTRVKDALLDLDDVPAPHTERELAWLLSWAWHVDEAYENLAELARHRKEGHRPSQSIMSQVKSLYIRGVAQGLQIPETGQETLRTLGIR